MAETKRHWVYRKRTWLLSAMGIGVVIGTWLPTLKFGFGGGGSKVVGTGQSPGESLTDDGTTGKAEKPVAKQSPAAKAEPKTEPPVKSISLPTKSKPRAPYVSVVIAERSYRLRTGNRERAITLGELVELVQQAPGDEDGIRVRIHREPSSRVSAEEALREALTAVEIEEAEVVWVPLDADMPDVELGPGPRADAKVLADPPSGKPNIE